MKYLNKEKKVSERNQDISHSRCPFFNIALPQTQDQVIILAKIFEFTPMLN